MPAYIEGTVEIFDHHGVLVESVDGQVVSKKVKIMRENDAMKAVMGDSQARVSVGLDESMGGPFGYSNVKLRVNVTLSCDQNQASVTKAQQLCLDQCVEFLESNMAFAHGMLCAHLKHLYVKED